MQSQLNKSRPLVYLITSGETTDQTTSTTEDFSSILRLTQAAVAAGVDLIQLREKKLTARVLFELATAAVELVRGSSTKLLINDRADIASAAVAHGVHLTTTSLPVEIIRSTFGNEFLIGVSTHSLAEARVAKQGGADFVVFGPVFDTPSKSEYGRPQGLDELAKVTSELSPFPVLALGGIKLENVVDCLRAGARGVAGISMLRDAERLAGLTSKIHQIVQDCRTKEMSPN
jgi:thiamine-phosphate pyrophosphorylase